MHPEFVDYGYNAAANRPRSPLRGPGAVHERQRSDGTPALSGQRIELTPVVAERDLVAVRLTCDAAHAGPLMGAKPSGRAIRYQGLVICRVKDARIFEQWGGFDSLDLAQQLGRAPAGTWEAPSEVPARAGGPVVTAAPGTPREVVRAYWEGTFNSRSFGALEAVVDPAFADHSFGAIDAEAHRGAPGLRLAEEAFLGAFPDCRVRVDDLFAENDLVCARLSSRGTHHGAWLGVAPTGKTFSYEGAFIWRVRNGKLTDRWGGFDRLLMAQHVGAVGRDVAPL